MSSLQTSNLELIIFNFIRNNYEHKYKQNVPMALKYITLQFSKRIIGCKLLTMKQDLDFFKLLCTKLPSIRRFKSLYKASNHQYSAKKFHEYCNDKGETITIIKSNWCHIFGGYTSKSWTSTNQWISDENAFLFLIKSDDESIKNKCPLLLELKKGNEHCAVATDSDLGPCFGLGHDICIGDNCNKKLGEKLDLSEGNYCYQSSYDNPTVNLCGGNLRAKLNEQVHLFQVVEYEVFQIVK